ncbi:MAG: hypothetical protein QXI76_04710 [Thermofilum sp.]
MLEVAGRFLAVGQISESAYFTLLLINFSISLGLLVGFLYSIRYFFKNIKPERDDEVNKRLEILTNQFKEIQESISKINIAPVLEKIAQLESKITSLEGRTAVLERRLTRPIETRPPPTLQPKPSLEEEPPPLAKLSDVILVAPDVKFAGVITSQGFLVESYGSCSEEPARLLEIVRLYGTSATSIVKGKFRFDIFYLGDVKDISVYGILEFRDGIDVAEQVVSKAKKAISRYFNERLAAKGESAYGR